MAEDATNRLPIPEPEPIHPRTPETESDDEREATELRDVSADAARASRILRVSKQTTPHWYDPVTTFWLHHVRVSVPHDDCRDHLANERTFLGYLRTSLALSMIGILVAQLYRLQHAPTPNPMFGYFVLSKPIAGLFQGAALYTALVGAHRFFRQQSAMVRGKVHAAGWEVSLTASFVLLLMVAMFALHVAVDIVKE